MIHNAIKNAYQNYIASVCTESPKQFWLYITSLKVARDGAKLEADNSSKAEILNREFKCVFTAEDPSQEPGNNILPMPDITISHEGVEKLLKNLDPNEATGHGPDNIGPRIFQIAAEELAPALSLIFQRSLDTGDLPESWLQANVSPVRVVGLWQKIIVQCPWPVYVGKY